jgi:hypothetical protein
MVMGKMIRHNAGLKPCSYDPTWCLPRSCRPLGLLCTEQPALPGYLVNDHKASATFESGTLEL